MSSLFARLRNPALVLCYGVVLLFATDLLANDYYVTQRLVDDCQHSIELWEGRPGDVQSAAMCLGFINGVMSIDELYRRSESDCRPDLVPPGSVAYALSRHVTTNPQWLGESAVMVLHQVLSKMYQCELSQIR